VILPEFLKFSQTLGDDFDLVQGAGGNTSIKTDNSLFVKASGFQLSEALKKDIFTEVALGGNPLSPAFKSLDGKRPSIETSFHMLMPQKVVVHVHSVHIIALSTLIEAADVFGEMLADMDWTLVGYARPGLPLATAIANTIKGGAAPEVVILANHGLIVAGATISEVAQKIEEIKHRASRVTRQSLALSNEEDAKRAVTDAAALAPKGYGVAKSKYAHIAARDEHSFMFATGGSLYPDHVVFLGRGAVGVPRAGRLPEKPVSKLLLMQSVGAFLENDGSETAQDMAGAMGRIVSLIPIDARVNYLTADQETELMNWEAEKFRTALAKAH